MSDLSQAEQYLLEQIRQGRADGWAQLVERYQGRLLAFARSRAGNSADAEDLVQDTLMQFLKGLPAYRGQASLETYLFMILRRRIIDWMRGRKVNVCLLQDSIDSDGGSDSGGSSGIEPAADDPTASTYARRDEQLSQERSALVAALTTLIDNLKEKENFRDLKVVEMLFYGQLRNRDIAPLAGVDESAVALTKHRWLKQLRQLVANQLRGTDLSALETPDGADSMLTEIWEANRLSCPKRSTVGGFLLGTLDSAWNDYVDFHVNKLGCRFCQANLHDLQEQTTTQSLDTLRDRVMQSTVGFFKKS